MTAYHLWCLWILILCMIEVSQSNFDCISLVSSPTRTYDDSETSITCTNTNYTTLVSCGFSKVDDPESKAIDGGYMTSDGTTCIAQNGWGSGTSSVAYARYK